MDSAGLSRWPEVLMLAQVVLLYLLTTQLAKIQSQLKLVLTSAAVASVPAAAGGEVQPQQSPRPSASSVGVKLARKPTLDNLLPDESYIQHQAYTREVARLYNAANSKAKGRRLYKVVYVLDLRGMGVAHLNKRLLSLIKEVNELFGWYYPETVYQFYIINVPLVFRTGWSIIKPWIHPITAAKFAVLGGDWGKRLDQAGISLTGGDLPRRLPSWMAEAERLLERETLETLSLGYMPHDDLASLGIQAPG
ncbi:hypothetical protein EMIHUDRAFT_456499 [Emiliania huxleyi CCMP1516]|uniref:CRAL-TRIO domain-containing protein n=2 Tax=Emiliania huxleyi TaxID=2903 RepID=A0A0D3K4C2_EMIH1|nr:hypothetical protein EMIHUDRAFT_456499 [Emiliania huxleyi CCMP1516]EOD30607.1 hypothetical protein EMIHUDRAFT_456499 [Emiliania huxleyi CCMP1516]|eukprot:XP_005783036.1 hypothetical protein EMIHUDRAFT_456499 [Emiliania huxleyi CCMP1516]